MRVAFQGELGAYSEEAIIQQFGDKAQPVPRPYLRDVFETVEGGEADLGLVPAENSLEGSIVRTFDLLLERGLKIQGEAVLRVVHCLIANKGVTLEDLKRVYSHPQALGQSRAYLEGHDLDPVSWYDTAGSVKMIRDKGLHDAAAIASARAAKVYNMAVLARGLETDSENYTRFFVIGSGENYATGKDCSTIAYIVDHRPGTLLESLRVFASRGLNLTKIESRPIPGRPWEYTFFIDIEAHKDEPLMRDAIEELGGHTNFIKILGSYSRAQ
ncbi:prephenate dehydratase [Candidatus Bathyarchaeota archaeon]|jgi:prephenate dehydratase|nr:prephenate dehydratase [Candidatus Bathyarchaeota archaeon]MDP6047943.1 prephenate dehydratase [Candidatus Bathyarchaeota archaeon]MDP7207100.1 prephenate dehydratase [Candidatus Bathyarchaeota archaeon]MDP7443048.1 prephenate dehydratase [Candidatus Bathyarchaeota archaeon]|tara:strand:- start:2367 stop:3179 length:813 start_codon:yes stop_codon:yes gene_type:complete